ncbi:Tautomerase/MIF [Amanita muscaria]
MPYLNLITNVKLGAEVLSKPEEYISVSITYNDTLTFNGTFDPAFQLVITSLGNINGSKNVVYSKKLFSFLKEKLGIPDNRGYIVFQDPGVENLGFRSTTFFA